MRACVQRVTQASVTVDGQVCGRIGPGLVVLLGVAVDDTAADSQALADKIVGLRIFDDAEGKMNLALADAGGAMLVVSQFTLLGDCRKGRRPSFTAAAPPELAESLRSVRGRGPQGRHRSRDGTISPAHASGAGERWPSDAAPRQPASILMVNLNGSQTVAGD